MNISAFEGLAGCVCFDHHNEPSGSVWKCIVHGTVKYVNGVRCYLDQPIEVLSSRPRQREMKELEAEARKESFRLIPETCEFIDQAFNLLACKEIDEARPGAFHKARCMEENIRGTFRQALTEQIRLRLLAEKGGSHSDIQHVL